MNSKMSFIGKMSLYSSLVMIVGFFLSSPSFAISAGKCSAIFSTQGRRPLLQDIQKAMESLTSPEEQSLFYVPEWDFDFLAPNNEYGTKRMLVDSYKSPQPFYNKKSQRDGGIVMFHGHIFVDAYFRDQRFMNSSSALTTAQLAKAQPWFRWDEQTQTYQKQHGGTQAVLMEDYLRSGQGGIKLYRGLNESQVQDLQALKGGKLEVLKKIFSERTDALFFSPDIKVAKAWSDGYYIELTVTPEMLMKSYVGIEYDYLEIAIYDAQVLVEAVKSMKVNAN